MICTFNLRLCNKVKNVWWLLVSFRGYNRNLRVHHEVERVLCWLRCLFCSLWSHEVKCSLWCFLHLFKWFWYWCHEVESWHPFLFCFYLSCWRLCWHSEKIKGCLSFSILRVRVFQLIWLLRLRAWHVQLSEQIESILLSWILWFLKSSE